ncbi:MAG: lysophospholipid acyltransferase family protein [Flammeovirgaceae bacterium]|nr:lysophospholipid acyltransferase family protein [Flammeovirgaceae bacterium]
MLHKILYYGLVYPLSKLPFFILYRISDALYLILYHIIRFRKEVVKQNLKNSFPNESKTRLNNIERSFYRHFCDLFVESIKAFTICEEDSKKRMIYKNVQLFNSLATKKRNVTLMGGHYGNWELLAISINAIMPHQCIALYNPLKNLFWEGVMKKSRSRFGLQLTSIKNPTAIVRLKGQLSCTIYGSDQSPRNPNSAHWTTFLNQETGFQRGAERFARDKKDAIVFARIRKIKRGFYETEFNLMYEEGTELPPNRIMEDYKMRLEAQIIEDPRYYLWTHKRWKHKRPLTPTIDKTISS